MFSNRDNKLIVVPFSCFDRFNASAFLIENSRFISILQSVACFLGNMVELLSLNDYKHRRSPRKVIMPFCPHSIHSEVAHFSECEERSERNYHRCDSQLGLIELHRQDFSSPHSGPDIKISSCMPRKGDPGRQ